MAKTLPPIFISPDVSIKTAMRVIDAGGLGIAFAVGKKRTFFGLITDGDIRKAILRGLDTDTSIRTIVNRKPALIKKDVTRKKIEALKARKDIIPSGGSLKVPILDAANTIKDILLLYADEKKNIIMEKSLLALPARSLGVKKVLIVGGAGYLGSVLCRLLLKEGYIVRVLDNLTYGSEGIDALRNEQNFHFIKGDCRNIPDIIEAMKGADAVIHLAAIVGDPACAIDPEETIENNYLATMVLAQAAKFNQINKYLFASSCSVYGASKDAHDRLTEESPLNPVSLYARTKIRSEEALLRLGDENFSPTIFRFATLYGASPRMRFDLVINILTAKAVHDKTITIFGGDQYRPFVEVSDAARACMAWLKAPLQDVGGQIFNIGSNAQNHRIAEIGQILKELIPGVRIERKTEADDLRDYNVSFDKVAKMLRFKPRKTIPLAVKEMKRLLATKMIKDYTHPQYNNYKFVFSLNSSR